MTNHGYTIVLPLIDREIPCLVKGKHMAAWADPRVKLKAQASMRRCFLRSGDPASEVTERS